MNQVFLGRYETTPVYLGVGTQARVIRGVDLHTQEPVAIRLSPGPLAQERIARLNVTASVRVNHPHVVRTLDAGLDGDEFVIVTELVEGTTLEQFLQQHGRCDPDQARVLIDAVVAGLSAVHQAGYLHLDPKPANVMLDRQGRAKLLDFGSSRLIHDCPPSLAGKPAGTPLYMAPEMVIDPASAGPEADTYPAGVMLHQLLTGVAPFQDLAEAELLKAKVSQDPPPPNVLVGNLPADLVARCMRMLARDPATRGGCSAGSTGDPTRHGPTRCLACGARLRPDPTGCGCCGRTIPADRPALTFTAGPARGQQFLIPRGRFETGRLQISPTDLSMSRRQMRVCCGGSVSVCDLSSRRTTRLDDGPITIDTFLRPGTCLRVGGSRAVFAMQGVSR